jgi:hypothetical protein
MAQPRPTIILTQDQENLAIAEFKKSPDIMGITRKVFGDDTLDGRCAEGKVIKKFLTKKGLNPDTTKPEKVGLIDLDVSQKAFLMGASVDIGMNALEIARLMFKDETIMPLSQKHRTTLDYLKKNRPEILDDEDILAEKKWSPPTTVGRVVELTNKWAGTSIDKVTMNNKLLARMNQLLLYLRSPRLLNFINDFKSQSDRDLFEGEFIRSVHDKPDLTNDELNAYITVCTNYIRQKHIQRRMARLNRIAADADTDKDMTIKFTELLKGTNMELNDCEKRIETALKGLNGTRTERLKAHGRQNGSILALVTAFEDKEERDRIVMMAEMENELNAEEANRLENMDELKARILGITKEEIL